MVSGTGSGPEHLSRAKLGLAKFTPAGVKFHQVLKVSPDRWQQLRKVAGRFRMFVEAIAWTDLWSGPRGRVQPGEIYVTWCEISPGGAKFYQIPKSFQIDHGGASNLSRRLND